MKLTQAQFEALQAKGLEPTQHKLEGFAEACFDMNSAESLMDFDTAEPDSADMNSWEMDADEWRDGQREALEAAMADYLDEQE